MAPAPEFGKRQYRTPTQSPRQPGGNGSSGVAATLKLAVVGFAVAALAVGAWITLSVPERLAPLLARAGGPGSGLDFSGDRVGRASTAPLLKVCIDMEPYLNGSENELEPADILTVLEGANLQSRGTRLLGGKTSNNSELSLALHWGGVADCTYLQDATRLCDIDNRALAVEAGSSLVRQADRILAAATAAPGDLQSLRATRDRVLDALRRHVQGGVLIAADFSSFAPAAIRDVLKTTEPVRNDCARQ